MGALGSEPGQSLAVDGYTATAEVPIAELGLRCGSILEVGDRGDKTRPAGPVGVFNRPPRITETAPGIELVPPQRPAEPGAPLRFGWAALVVPVLLGLVMAVVIHPRMAAFALFSPAMLLANWFEDRRRVRRVRLESDRVYASAVREFRAQLSLAYRDEAERRRSAGLTPEALVERCNDVRLWERRRKHDDFMCIPIGSGCIGWDVPVSDPASMLASLIAGYTTLHDVPITLDLVAGAVVGIAGTRAHILAIARQLLLQAAVGQGPADLAIAVLTERPFDWDWAKWLPHLLVDTTGRRRIAVTPGQIDEVVAELEANGDKGALHLLVVDLPDLASPERTPIRDALEAGAVAGIALAPRATGLPSLSTTVVVADQEQSYVRRTDGTVNRLDLWTVDRATARRVARSLARIDDPEAALAGARLPSSVALVDLLDLDTDLICSIRLRWQTSARPVTPIGSVADGGLEVDLVADGPHALLGGTTGAGKSELLRSLVAGLAVNVSPELLNLILIDYKGGSAFDSCADLPHTVGVITDLDDHLASRALVCLEAELRYREQRLRSHGVSDVAELSSPGLLPRLLVVVDEFAALAKELPQFMDALVDVAQRGRSLGVHLLLATQRPAGVIADNIRANTNLRMVLRVQDAADSVDVIGNPEAASIPRSLPGRGLARLGPAEVVEFQAAHVSGHQLSREKAQVLVAPFVVGMEQPDRSAVALPAPGSRSDLEQIVAGCRRVAGELALAPPRSPWPNPLPERIIRDEVAHRGPVFAIADEPHRQRVMPVEWDPTMGNTLFCGLPGSGTTTALASLAMALATHCDASRLHIYVLDCDDHRLLPLQGLPHVGAVIARGERERQLRLLRTLGAELERRRERRLDRSGKRDDPPAIVMMIDNLGGLARSFGEPSDMNVHDLLARLLADGPGVGIVTVATAKQPADVSSRISATIATRLIFQLAERYDYTGLGLPAMDPPRHPGRAFESGSAREIQVVFPHEHGLAAAVAAAPLPQANPGLGPSDITVLPSRIPLEGLLGAASISDDEWFLPLGIGDSTRQPVGLLLRDGEHALIAGPPRSGKTSALLTIARVARHAARSLRIAAVAPGRSALSSSDVVDEVIAAADLDALDTSDQRLLLLVDDAELLDGGDPLGRLLRRRSSRVRVIAAGSTDVIRSLYGHWTQELRRSRIGCVLRPSDASDGDLWHARLPQGHHRSFPVGRGYLLGGGQTELVQLGHP